MRGFLRWLLVGIVLVGVVVLLARAHLDVRVDRSRESVLPSEVFAQTAAADRFRYVAEIVVDRPGEAVVRLRDEGAVDRGAGRSRRAVTLSQDGRTVPALRAIADGDAIHLQPGPAASVLGQEPHAWLGARKGAGAPAWADADDGLPPPLAMMRRLLEDVDGEIDVVGENRVRLEAITGSVTVTVQIEIDAVSGL